MLNEKGGTDEGEQVGFDVNDFDASAFDLVRQRRFKMEKEEGDVGKTKRKRDLTLLSPKEKEALKKSAASMNAKVEGNAENGAGGDKRKDKENSADSHPSLSGIKDQEREVYETDDAFVIDRGGFVGSFYNTEITGYSYKEKKLSFCLRWQALDVWTYEYCHRQHLTQSRIHSDNGVEETAVIVVGKYDENEQNVW